FFTGFSEAFLPRLLLAAAFEPGDPDPAAMSFLVVKNGTMWGRYWGTRIYYRDLHFNLCYYSPIEWAIKHGIRQFDPGAGSPHKLRRGFQAVAGSSFHYFLNPLLQKLFAGNIGRINRHEADRIFEMNREIPWKGKT
ncbi:MAG: peptidogalycan biosysnthesis protein, partial [Spirochaetia bacterium]